MSLVPFLLEELIEETRRETITVIPDQHFGLGLFNNELNQHRHSFINVSPTSYYHRAWRASEAGDSGISNVRTSNEAFKVNLDVQQFLPDELKAKVVDEFLIVEGSHGEKEDAHGFISRQFVRRYRLPPNVDVKHLSSSLSPDGVLSLVAPINTKSESFEREIPILRTDIPAVEVDQDSSSEMPHEISGKDGVI